MTDDRRVIDLEATWNNIQNQPPNGFERHGLTIKNGIVCEIGQYTVQIGKAYGELYFPPVKDDLIVYAT